MYVFVQGYEAGAAAGEPLAATVGLYKDGKKMYESQPIAGTPAAGNRLGTVPLTFTVEPHGLPPGEYQCQVTVVDPTRAKATYWQAPILLVP